MHIVLRESPEFFVTVTAVCWCIFYCYWLIKAFHTKDNVYVQGIADRVISRIGIMTIFVLLYLPQLSFGWIGLRLLPQSPVLGIAAVIICAAGVAFSIWARTVLGGNWSGAVTLKKDHEIIMHGPYRFVRHPIYTGYLFATLGSALAVGEIRGAIALVLVVAGIFRKMDVEERLLSKNFPDTYPEYSKRVRKLIPFVL